MTMNPTVLFLNLSYRESEEVVSFAKESVQVVSGAP